MQTTLTPPPGLSTATVSSPCSSTCTVSEEGLLLAHSGGCRYQGLAWLPLERHGCPCCRRLPPLLLKLLKVRSSQAPSTPAAAARSAAPCAATSEHLLSGKSGMMELHIVTKLVPA